MNKANGGKQKMEKWYRPIATHQGTYSEHVHEWPWVYSTREQAQTVLDRHHPEDKHEIREEEISLDPFTELLDNKSLLKLLTEEDNALRLIRTYVNDAPKYGVNVDDLAKQKERYLQARRDIKRYLVELLAD